MEGRITRDGWMNHVTMSAQCNGSLVLARLQRWDEDSLLNHLGAFGCLEYLDGFGLGSGGVPVFGRFQKK
jgi:hypothetical protein